jgi:hypothetical protein
MGPANLCNGDAECFCEVRREFLSIKYMQFVHYWVKFLVGSSKRNEIGPCHEFFFVCRMGFDNCPINASLIRCSETNVFVLVLLRVSVQGFQTAVLWGMTPCSLIET